MFRFDQRFKANAGASQSQVTNLERELQKNFPSSFREFLLEANGGIGVIGSDGYIELWSTEKILESYKGYEFDKYLPDYVPIGSNGGGEAFVIKFKGNDYSYGYLPFGDLNEESFLEFGRDFWNSIGIIAEGKAFSQ